MDMQLTAVTVRLDGSLITLSRNAGARLFVSVQRKGKMVLERVLDVVATVDAWEAAKMVIAAAQGVSYEKRVATNSEVQEVADLLQRVGS